MSNLIRSRTSRVSAVLATAAVSLGMFAGPAAAQPQQNGLVNVYVDDVLTENNIAVGVGVAAGVAANVCGVDVNAAVLGAVQNRGGDTVACEADADNVEVRFEPVNQNQ